MESGPKQVRLMRGSTILTIQSTDRPMSGEGGSCLLRSDALARGADFGCDDRAFHMSTVSSMDVESSLVYFYPRLLALHTLNPEETGLLDQVRCTMEKVRVNGVYLLENGLQPLLFAGIAAHPTWIQVLVTPRFTSLSSGNF